MIDQKEENKTFDMGHEKFEKIFPKVVNAIFSGDYIPSYSRNSFHKVYELYNKIKSNPSELETCKHGMKHLCDIKLFNMLESRELIDGVINLFSLSPYWVRDIKSFERPSRNVYKQLSSLTRHLFAKYPVPEFLEAAWYGKSADSKHMGWYVHLGEGKSIKDLDRMPIPMTKKMLHVFLGTPACYGINDGIRRAQVIFLGGDERLVSAIIGTKLGRFHDAYREKFWDSFITFIAKAPMFDYEHIGPIIDYIEHQKFEVQRIPLENGKVEVRPLQAGFSMKGRQLDMLIRDSEMWHKKISKHSGKDGKKEFWDSSGIKGYELAEGDPESRNAKLFQVVELLTSKELMDEGRVMGHCVYSYSHSCVRKTSSIWSLREKYMGERLATIEINLSTNMIIQIRAKKNARASQKAESLIYRWAENSKLSISKSAFGGFAR